MIIKMTAAQLSRWISFGGGTIRQIMGYNANAADVYLQLFETSNESSSVVVSNGAVPTLGSLLCNSVNGFKFDFGTQGMSFKELVIACSSTQPSLTLVGAGAGLDMTLDVSGNFLVDNFPTLTVVGDLTTTIQGLQVWAEAAGPHSVVRVDTKTITPGLKYVVGYAVDTAAVTSNPQFVIPAPVTVLTPASFGQGFAPFEKTPNQTLHNGLTINPQTVSSAAVNANDKDFVCRAMYI